MFRPESLAFILSIAGFFIVLLVIILHKLRSIQFRSTQSTHHGAQPRCSPYSSEHTHPFRIELPHPPNVDTTVSFYILHNLDFHPSRIQSRRAHIRREVIFIIDITCSPSSHRPSRFVSRCSRLTPRHCPARTVPPSNWVPHHFIACAIPLTLIAIDRPTDRGTDVFANSSPKFD